VATARTLALYLPQYHPIPENDEWWGPGFTEWTNVAAARPLFRGHDQPRIPGELGFYDLRLPDARQAQADLAAAAGIEAFCYWHYWFAGRRLLERPFDEVLRSGEPDFPFCLAWANQSWTGIWHGAADRVLMEQTYPGDQDHEAHFRAVSIAMRDDRYVRVDGKPIFLVYQPLELPEPLRFTDLWRTLAEREGFSGLHLVGVSSSPAWDPRAHGFDASVITRLLDILVAKASRPDRRLRRFIGRRLPPQVGERTLMRRPLTVDYGEIASSLVVDEALPFEYFPCVTPNWDNTPRSGRRGYVVTEATPERFAEHLRQAVARVQDLPPEHRIVVLKSWNEWAEGNYVEPDQSMGRGYLDALRQVLLDAESHRAPGRSVA
jgi:lipopolysaccharide biosynthesis protein